MSAYVENTPCCKPAPVKRALSWMDERGPMSWIVLMVAGFIFGGPLGLVILAFILITGRFKRRNYIARVDDTYGLRTHVMRGTGNSAFDSYKADTLARLEREQADFEAFLARLRHARDKAEFDQYMDDRAKAASETPDEPAQDPKPGAY